MPSEAADIRIFNQAMMELGATLLRPIPPRSAGTARCGRCVWGISAARRRRCRKKAKKERRIEEKTVFPLPGTEGVALRKRPKTGLLAGLWEFPNVPGTLDESAAAAAVADMGLTPVDWKSRLTAKHIFTHVEWHMTGYILTARGSGAAGACLGGRLRACWARSGTLGLRTVLRGGSAGIGGIVWDFYWDCLCGCWD